MNRSDQIDQIATALSKAQGGILAATKNAENPFFKSKYADLGSILDVIRAPAAENGLSYICSPPEVANRRKVQLVDKDGVEYDEFLCDVTTQMLLMHVSGQWFAGSCELTAIDSMHGIGSASTYGIRYCLRAMFSVATEDDDGNAAKPQGQPSKRREPPQPAPALKSAPRADSEIEQQLRNSVNQARQPAEDDLGRLVAEAAKALGWNKVQTTQACMEECGAPWGEMSVSQRRGFLEKLSARLTGGQVAS